MKSGRAALEEVVGASPSGELKEDFGKQKEKKTTAIMPCTMMFPSVMDPSYDRGPIRL